MANHDSRLLPIAILLVCLSHIVLVTARAPAKVPWSKNVHGPDGPWHAVVVELGNPPVKVDLYPASHLTNWIPCYKFCRNKSLMKGLKECSAQNRATWDYRKSSSAMNNVDQEEPASPGWMGPLQQDAGPPRNVILDSIRIGTPGDFESKNNSITAMDYAYVYSYPNGKNYPISVGSLSVGAPIGYAKRHDAKTRGHPEFNESILPSDLYINGITPSNSFALQVGSVAAGIEPSLIFGGYDKNRVLGRPIIQSYPQTHVWAMTLVDINIGAVKGGSPFDFTFKQGLLAKGNSSINESGLQIYINPGTPYISLPSSACGAIVQEANLPVTYHQGLALYLWNTEDPRYESIVRSASYLGFKFLNPVDGTHMTINVPWKLLNLTLESPIMETPTAYFPCYTLSSSDYTLGRAFLQSAYMGTNWRRPHGHESLPFWFISQAPGPGISNKSSDIQSLGFMDTNWWASDAKWESSWSGHWSRVQDTKAASLKGPKKASQTPPNSPGLSKDAKIAIGTGVGVGVIIMAAIAAYILAGRDRRHRFGKEIDSSSTSSPNNQYAEKDGHSRQMFEAQDRWYTRGEATNPAEAEQPIGAPVNPAEAFTKTPLAEAYMNTPVYEAYSKTPMVEAPASVVLPEAAPAHTSHTPSKLRLFVPTAQTNNPRGSRGSEPSDPRNSSLERDSARFSWI